MVVIRDNKGRFVKGTNPSPETQFKKGDKAHLGYKNSDEIKVKMSKSAIGKHNLERNGFWKGDKVGYFALHAWIKRNFGKPMKCENCGQTEGRIEWANKDHKYSRNREDWQVLCKKCHYQYDFKDVKRERDENGRFKKDNPEVRAVTG